MCTHVETVDCLEPGRSSFSTAARISAPCKRPEDFDFDGHYYLSILELWTRILLIALSCSYVYFYGPLIANYALIIQQVGKVGYIVP